MIHGRQINQGQEAPCQKDLNGGAERGQSEGGAREAVEGGGGLIKTTCCDCPLPPRRGEPSVLRGFVSQTVPCDILSETI